MTEVGSVHTADSRGIHTFSSADSCWRFIGCYDGIVETVRTKYQPCLILLLAREGMIDLNHMGTIISGFDSPVQIRHSLIHWKGTSRTVRGGLSDNPQLVAGFAAAVCRSLDQRSLQLHSGGVLEADAVAARQCLVQDGFELAVG